MSGMAHTWAEALRRQSGKPRAIYADPYDPITAWHLAVIHEAAPLLGELILLVTSEPHADLLFSVEERTTLVRDLTRSLRNVTVLPISRPAHEVAREKRARFVLRTLGEGEDPRKAAEESRRDYLWAPELTPVFVPLPQRVAAVGSKELKTLARAGACLSRYCHPRVARRLKERLRERLTEVH